jgi:hypothetical protein
MKTTPGSNVINFFNKKLSVKFLLLFFQKIERSSTIKLDRWNITITENPEGMTSTDGEKENNNQLQAAGSDKIPFNIINNYFSIGVVSLASLRDKKLDHFLNKKLYLEH